MTTDASAPAPHFAVAGAVLDAMSTHDFEQLLPAFADDARLEALLPSAYREWHGARDAVGAFELWFGDAEQFEVVDASVGQVGPLLQLRWQLRVRSPRRGDGPMTIEQVAYASVDETGRIDRMRLLCSGFWPEHASA
jgi:hypothetical protein